jgi:hypothetical protein
MLWLLRVSVKQGADPVHVVLWSRILASDWPALLSHLLELSSRQTFFIGHNKSYYPRKAQGQARRSCLRPRDMLTSDGSVCPSRSM